MPIGPEQRERARLNREAALQRRAGRQSQAGVYVLSLNDPGFYYVGQSSDVERRIEQHRCGGTHCSELCNDKGGVCRSVSPLTPQEDSLPSWEQKETLARMMKHGFNQVRGWEFTSGWKKLNYENLNTIRTNIFGHGDLCRKCGGAGHFAERCPGGKAEWLQELEQLIEDAQPRRRKPSAVSTFQQLANGSEASDRLQSKKRRRCEDCDSDISDRPSHHMLCHECYSGGIDSKQRPEKRYDTKRRCEDCDCDISDRPSHHMLCHECWCDNSSESSESDDYMY